MEDINFFSQFDKILLVAPHPDDEILFAYSVLHGADKTRDALTVLFVTEGPNTPRSMELAAKIGYRVMSWKNEFLSLSAKESHIIQAIDAVVRSGGYDCLIAPSDCYHQDHRIVNRACRVAMRPFRTKLRACIEYPYTDPEQKFEANLYVPVPVWKYRLIKEYGMSDAYIEYSIFKDRYNGELHLREGHAEEFKIVRFRDIVDYHTDRDGSSSRVELTQDNLRNSEVGD